MRNNKSMFQVNLNGLELNADQTRELEERLTAATTDFLGSFKEGKAYLSDAVAYKPNPDDPDPWPWPWGPIVGPFPFPIPRPFPGFFPIQRKILDQNFQKVKF